MQRFKEIGVNLTRMSFNLKNFCIANAYSNASACCCSKENRSLLIAVVTNRRYPVKLTFATANLLTYLGLAKKNVFEELEEVVEKGEKALLEKNFQLAEQLFHEALKIAQIQLKNEVEVTRIYTKLAEVAFENGDYKAAKKLLSSVMERLLSVGVDRNDLKILDISLKLAKTSERLKKYRDAELGYQYCIHGIQNHLTAENLHLDDAQEFLLMLLVDYAYFNHERGLLNKALEYFRQAYEVCVRTRGEDDQKTVFILNNLGYLYREKGDSENALQYFQKAEKLGENYPNLKDVAYVHLNLGYLHLEKNMLYEARRHCKQALKKSKKIGDIEVKKESQECLASVRKATLMKLYSQIW